MSQGISINLTPQGVADKVKSSWCKSIFTPVESTRVSKAAIIFDGQEKLMEYIQPHLMFDPMPVELFEGNYHQTSGKVVSILAGLPWSFKRLHDIESSITQQEERLKEATVERLSYQAVGITTNKLQKQPINEKKSVMDILSKYKR
jgi:hypothetical protein